MLCENGHIQILRDRDLDQHTALYPLARLLITRGDSFLASARALMKRSRREISRRSQRVPHGDNFIAIFLLDDADRRNAPRYERRSNPETRNYTAT